MKSGKGKEFRNMLSAIAVIAFLYGIFDMLGIGCPIKFVTGISCLGCGMTRAWMSVLGCNPEKAFFYHPLFWLMPLALLLFLFKNKISKNIFCFLEITVIMLFGAVYVIRLLQADNNIVVFQPENNILFRMIKLVYNER